jgi:hypothetical protein
MGKFAKANFGGCEIRQGKGSSLIIELFYNQEDYKCFEPRLRLVIYEKECMSRKCLKKVLHDFDKAGLGDLKNDLLGHLNN